MAQAQRCLGPLQKDFLHDDIIQPMVMDEFLQIQKYVSAAYEEVLKVMLMCA
jgi:hypothetical protein